MSSLTDDTDAARILMAEDALLTDGAGKQLTISSLLPTEEHAVLVVVFIRHFSCGSCSGYVEALSTDEVVRQLQEHHARLIIVGHGAQTFIDSYKCKCLAARLASRTLDQTLKVGLRSYLCSTIRCLYRTPHVQQVRPAKLVCAVSNNRVQS